MEDLSMSTASLKDALFALPMAERIAMADVLYASVPPDWQRATDQAWLEEAVGRSDEMDSDPSQELSEEEYIQRVELPRLRQ